eukprot:TRINITY_DN56412_c0_g1_i1.p1 TRINITY_DN56412_c0_g1~~TRINITY_DN56412_c0_g1_i1.p1  ORF type:complete len:932 (+),score=157.82 TRINITY_DN56412_c0_g1_i1:92-2797(+)
MKGGKASNIGKSGKNKSLGPIIGHAESHDTFNRFCQLRQAKPQFLYNEVPGFSSPGGSGWRCTIKVPGIALETQRTAASKKEAQEQATLDFALQLVAQGLMKMPSKRQLEKNAAELPAVTPSWAIMGGAADIILPSTKIPKKGEKSKGKNKGKEEKTKGRNVDQEYHMLLNHVRAGEIEDAMKVVKERLTHDKNVFTVRQFGAVASSISVRSSSEGVQMLLSAIETMDLVDFEDTASRSYFARFLRWASREFLAEGANCLRNADEMSVSVLERNGVCVPQLSVTQGKETNELNLSSSGPLPSHSSFTRGDWLFLTFPHTARVGQHSGLDGKLPATVEAELTGLLPVGNHGFIVKTVGVKLQLAPQLVGKFCRIDRAANHVTFSRQVEALRALCAGAPGPLGWLRQILLMADQQPGSGLEAALCAKYHGGAGCPNRFDILSMANPSQYEALKAATSQRMTLIQGPPGAGKTSTALLCLRLWIAAKRGPVMAAADSNVAVDNIVSGCAKAGLNVTRVGRQEATRPDLDEYNLIEKAKAAGISTGERNNFAGEKRLLEESEVICCTCSGAAHPVMRDLKVQCVLIDEAGQATELAKLVPMLHLTADGCAVLVGDHKQLPPTVACLEADVEGLGTSLFERLASLGVPPLLLDIQYRMHPCIAAFPSQEFYGGYLRTGVSGAMRASPNGVVWPCPWAPVAFLPVEGTESGEGNSFVNEMEAATVDTVLSGIIGYGDIPAKEVGVITPYAAQARNLRRRFGCPPPGRRQLKKDTQEPVGHAAVEVSSVDGFQGREKEIIIVSTVRANTKGKVGFLSDPRRLNVMLTRAKRGMVVIGHFETLANDEHGWRPFLVWAQQRGLVAGCPPTCEAAHEELKMLSGLTGDDLLNWKPHVGQEDEPMPDAHASL